MPEQNSLSLIQVKIDKDDTGFPTHALISERGRTLDVTYNPDGLLSFRGKLLDNYKPILQMIWPFSEPTSFPDVLRVVQEERNIIIYDDMEGLLKWDQSSGTVSLDNTNAYSGSQSVKMANGVGDASAVGVRRTTLFNKKTVEVSLRFAIDDTTKLSSLWFNSCYYSGREIQDCIVRYFQNTRIWAFNNQTILTLDNDIFQLINVGGCWNYLRYKIDFKERALKEFQYNSQIIKTNLPTTWGPDTTRENLLCTLTLIHQAGQAVNMWVDDYLITEY